MKDQAKTFFELYEKEIKKREGNKKERRK